MGSITMSSITNVIDSHKRFLKAKYPKHFQRYCHLLNHQPGSARAEAIASSFLRTRCDDAQVEEDLRKGGVDFRCKSKNGTEFVSEVTCLETESVVKRSKLKNKFPEVGFGGTFDMITDKLFWKVLNKEDQVSGYGCPQILIITCEHTGSSILLGDAGAEFLLTGDQIIVESIDKSGNPSKPGNVNSATNLKNAVFFRLKNGELESCRRSISAILLFSVSPDGTYSEIVGLLHPDPIYKFPICIFPSVPFLKLKQWPLKNGRIETEWVIHEKPKPDKFYHHGYDYPSAGRKSGPLFN
jgi:hypothetical protein